LTRLILPTLLAAAALAGCASTAGPATAPVAVAADTGAWQAPLPHGGSSRGWPTGGGASTTPCCPG
jgi:hypothetical protein